MTSVTFVREGAPEIHVIRYDTIASLVEAGIMPEVIPQTPAAFPASEKSYCPRPR